MTMTALLKIGLYVFLLALISIPTIYFWTLESLFGGIGTGLFLGFVFFWSGRHYYMCGGNGG